MDRGSIRKAFSLRLLSDATLRLTAEESGESFRKTREVGRQVPLNSERVGVDAGRLRRNTAPYTHEEPRPRVAIGALDIVSPINSGHQVRGSPRDRKYELSERFVLRIAWGVHVGFERIHNDRTFFQRSGHANHWSTLTYVESDAL